MCICLTVLGSFVGRLSSAYMHAGGSYQVFAGKECARALGKMAIEADQCTAEIGDLSRRELEILDDWELKFHQKYTVVGKVGVQDPLACAAYVGATKQIFQTSNLHLTVRVHCVLY